MKTTPTTATKQISPSSFFLLLFLLLSAWFFAVSKQNFFSQFHGQLATKNNINKTYLDTQAT